MNMHLKDLNSGLNSLVIFRDLLSDSVVKALSEFLSCGGDTVEQINRYSGFVYELYKETENLSEYIFRLVLEDENPYIVRRAQGIKTDLLMEECVRNELAALQKLSRFTSAEAAACIGYGGFLPKWNTSELDFAAEYRKRADNVEKYGYGMYARHKMFIVRDAEIVPVKYPDETRLSQLFSYEEQRKEVVDNTLALIEGRPAQNVLLYGDAGTGKSSTVKAIVNEYSDRGLRLIEVTKEQLRDLPAIIDSISRNPLKFIIFVDDLSFASDDDSFGALKATLEGSVSARARNICIYATSNRRHIVKEKFSDRDGDDIHRNDTMQELISLSARFGLRVNFMKPDKKQYLEIAGELAKQNNILISGDDLAFRAEAFATQGSGRSPRTAKQFIDMLISSSV